jgi:ubiquinone/menaquinone biosynthesis C-methylase UbiE
MGWQSFACDLSEEGQAKALQLAKSQKVDINYVVGDFGDLQYKNGYFDVVALIYAHFPTEVRAQYHQLADGYLKEGGHVIIEAFSKNHLKYNTQNPSVGGPKKEAMLFSVAQLQADFPNYEWHILKEQIIELHEGEYHRGTGSVVRAVGKKSSV